MEYLRGRQILWHLSNPDVGEMDHDFFQALADAKTLHVEDAANKKHRLICVNGLRMPMPVFDRLLGLDNKTRGRFLAQWLVSESPRREVFWNTHSGTTESLKAWGEYKSYLWHAYVRRMGEDAGAASLWIRYRDEDRDTEQMYSVFLGIEDAQVVLRGSIPDDLGFQLSCTIESIEPSDTEETMAEKEDALFFLLVDLGIEERKLYEVWPALLGEIED